MAGLPNNRHPFGPSSYGFPSHTFLWPVFFMENWLSPWFKPGVRQRSEDFAIMLEWFDAVGYEADIQGNACEYGIVPTSFKARAAEVAS